MFEIDFAFVGRGFIPIPERNKLSQHLVLEGTRHLEGQMASVAFNFDTRGQIRKHCSSLASCDPQ